MNPETVIISLGGSLIVPDDIDTVFLTQFKELILEQIKKGKKFIIITGGGKTCRKYQSAAREVSQISNLDSDWIGIASCNLNAELMRTIFSREAHDKVIYDLSKSFSLDKSIVIGGTFEPGHSSDMDAFIAAENLGVKKIINLSNTDYVYDSDPKVNPNAKKMEKISWAEYRKLIPEEWSAGFSSPFDPITSKLAEEAGIVVITMNGKNLENLKKCLEGGEFVGTTIY